MFLKRKGTNQAFPVVPPKGRGINKNQVRANKPTNHQNQVRTNRQENNQNQVRANIQSDEMQFSTLPEGWVEGQMLTWGNDPATAIDTVEKTIGDVYIQVYPVGLNRGGGYDYEIRKLTPEGSVAMGGGYYHHDEYTGKNSEGRRTKLFATENEAIMDAERQVKRFLK